MGTEQDYDAAAAWAEDRMRLEPASTTARRGAAAARHGQAALARAQGGRPSIDPAAQPGHHSPRRQVRLATNVDRALVALAQAQDRTPSEVLRDAVADYLDTHSAN